MASRADQQGIHPMAATYYESSRASIVGWKLLRTREQAGENEKAGPTDYCSSSEEAPPRSSTVRAAFFSSSVNYEQPLPLRSPKKKPKPAAAGKPLEHTHKRLPRRPALLARSEKDKKKKHSGSPENDVTTHIWA
ncbi:hypothetical protein HPB50_016386 [Hyalomma asiaticum]|uniref:Uncharacterized protein n=1 Tax=Hyalomma asiaticum TaxID=266040 RepID=A0ACB7SWC3_HYAAI|nr:hypothetical protein HPB50_016386 [Hyalomma asiaticum]